MDPLRYQPVVATFAVTVAMVPASKSLPGLFTNSRSQESR